MLIGLAASPEKDDTDVCSVCGYPESAPNPIVFVGIIHGVKLDTRHVITWRAAAICKSCFMTIEEIDKKGAMIAKGRKGWGSEHR